ncbi:MAG: hypothetical protein WB622_20290, partial [Acidobacteriaceae bacterium]
PVFRQFGSYFATSTVELHGHEPEENCVDPAGGRGSVPDGLRCRVGRQENHPTEAPSPVRVDSWGVFGRTEDGNATEGRGTVAQLKRPTISANVLFAQGKSQCVRRFGEDRV